MNIMFKKFGNVLAICVFVVFATLLVSENAYAANTQTKSEKNCYSYILQNGANGYTQNVNNYSFSLWYNSCTDENFNSFNALSTYANGLAWVERADGLTASVRVNPYGITNTHGVYSPYQLARACYDDYNNGHEYCTPWG